MFEISSRQKTVGFITFIKSPDLLGKLNFCYGQWRVWPQNFTTNMKLTIAGVSQFNYSSQYNARGSVFVACTLVRYMYHESEVKGDKAHGPIGETLVLIRNGD